MDGARAGGAEPYGAASLETLKKTCPESFAPFHEELTRAEVRLAGRARRGERRGLRRP